jgi:hypothetical protein
MQLEDRCTPTPISASFQFREKIPLPPSITLPKPININISQTLQFPNNPNLPQETLTFNFTEISIPSTPQTPPALEIGVFFSIQPATITPS